jgi:catechol 2,3-dioxygenase-like lactoylglutathione lyase family enzyme
LILAAAAGPSWHDAAMTEAGPLGRSGPVAFVASSDLDRSRAFYEGLLGLEVVGQDAMACVMRSGSTTVRVTLVPEVAATPYTVLGWVVEDLAAMVDALTARGISFLRFEGMGQDERGIWIAPGGDGVAWFPDPEGHVLSLTQPRG